MTIDRPTLESAILASGGALQPDDEIDGLLTKIKGLEATGRYNTLVSNFIKANDKSNFLALLLEVTFAYQFENAGMPLVYEVKQVANHCSSIDFRLTAKSGEAVFFELRLLQQDKATAEDIKEQLSAGAFYAVKKDGKQEGEDIYRLQEIILSKVQKKNGDPVKFYRVETGVINIVVVCISDLLLGTSDAADCLLAMYGDPEVPEHCQRGVFGLFQDTKPEYPEEIKARGARYAHIKGTLHGVLFVFLPSGSGVLNYELRQIMVWNRNLMLSAQAKALTEQFSQALPAKDQ